MTITWEQIDGFVGTVGFVILFIILFRENRK